MKKHINVRIICSVFFAGIMIAALTGCNWSLGDAKLMSFAFEKKYNNWLTEDIVGVIDEDAKTVTVTVPESAYQYSPAQPGKDAEYKKFKPSFMVSHRAALYKGTRLQKSGITEELFIENKDYRVIAEDGTSQAYTVCVNIAYDKPSVPVADADTIKNFYGTYRGELYFDHNYYKICVVFDGKKTALYSGPMSAVYINTDWEKDTDGNWVCRTYQRDNFERVREKNGTDKNGHPIKINQVKTTATFKVAADGKITCKMIVNAMGNAPSRGDIPKDAYHIFKPLYYVFRPGDGEGFSAPKWP